MASPKKPRRDSLITDFVRDGIKARRLSISKLATLSGVDRHSISLFIRGTQNVGGDTLDRLASVMDLRPVEATGRKAQRPIVATDTGRSVFDLIRDAATPEPATIPPAPGLPSAPDTGMEADGGTQLVQA